MLSGESYWTHKGSEWGKKAEFLKVTECGETQLPKGFKYVWVQYIPLQVTSAGN